MTYPSARRLDGRQRPAGPLEIDEEITRPMAKRQRGGARPGQRAPMQRSARPAAPAPAPASPAATPARPPGGLSDDELARAAELEAAIVAEDQAASAAVSRGRDRRRPGSTSGAVPRTRSAGSLTATAEEEYRYAMTDLRKIAVVFAIVFGLLVASWAVFTFGGVVPA